MKAKAIFFLVLLFFICCQTTVIGQPFPNEKCSDYVLQNLEKYQILGEFLNENADTLVAHNLNRSIKNIREELKKDYCYNWSLPLSAENLDRVPAFLQKDLLEKTALIEKKHLELINICLDGSIEFFVDSGFHAESPEETYMLIHILEYRSKEGSSPFKYESLNDTFKHPNFNYGIAAVED